MGDLPRPRAQRLRTPSWRDSRVLVGVFLVLLATAAGGWVIARADRTIPVYAAAAALVPGQAVTTDDLRRVDVRLGAGTAEYVSAARPLPPGRHVLRAVDEGELVPRTAIGEARDVETRVVAVQVDSTAASLLSRGAVVDVYVNRPGEGPSVGGRAPLAGPQRVLVGATVAGLPDATTVLGGVAGQRPVHLIVPAEAVQALVADIDSGARITLVPTPAGGAGS